MKIILLLLAIISGVITPSNAQVKTLKEPRTVMQPINRTGDGTAPITSETKDSADVLSDISAAFNLLEQSIEMEFNKLTEQNKDKIHDINDAIKRLEGEVEKQAAMRKKISDLEQITRQLEQEKQKEMKNVKALKSEAILHANELIAQKRFGDLQLFSKTTKTRTIKAREDSLQSIHRLYPVHQ
jgi:TolA-binding protein